MEVLRCLFISYLIFACWGYCSAHGLPPKDDGDKPLGLGDHGENDGSFEISGSGFGVEVGVFGPGRGQDSGHGRGGSSSVAWIPIPGLGGGVSVSIVPDGKSTCYDHCSACRKCDSHKKHSDHDDHKTGKGTGGQKRSMDVSNSMETKRERYGQQPMPDAKAPESQLAGHGA